MFKEVIFNFISILINFSFLLLKISVDSACFVSGESRDGFMYSIPMILRVNGCIQLIIDDIFHLDQVSFDF